MTEFRTRHRSVVTVPVEPERVWEVVTDPGLLAELNPLLDRISQRGGVWTWTMAGISVRRLQFAPTFTERVSLVPISRIEFRHEPPPGRTERAGFDGIYQITKVGDHASKLAIDLVLFVDLPLPGFGRRAVEKVLDTTVRRTRQAFARNLYGHLGIDADDVTIRVIEGDGGI